MSHTHHFFTQTFSTLDGILAGLDWNPYCGRPKLALSGIFAPFLLVPTYIYIQSNNFTILFIKNCFHSSYIYMYAFTFPPHSPTLWHLPQYDT